MPLLIVVHKPEYNPPQGDNVDFNFEGGYTPPDDDKVDFDFDA